MDEFLKENYSLLTYSVELLPVIVGLMLFKKYKKSPAKFIIYFLCFALFVDLIGSYPQVLKANDLFYLIEGTLIERNYWWFHFFWWCGLSFFVYFINYKVIRNIKLRAIIRYAYYFYLLQVALALIFRFEYLFAPDERVIKIASLWIVLLSIIVYFFEVLTSNRIVHFYKSIYFYFNATIFVWVLIMVPLDFFETYFNTKDWNYVFFKWKIYLGLNIFLYLTMTFALLYSRPEKE